MRVKGGATPDMRYAMGLFLAGLFMCGIAFFFAYVTQLRLLNESAGRRIGKFTHEWPLYISMFFVVLSLGAFSLGSLASSGVIPVSSASHLTRQSIGLPLWPAAYFFR